MVEATSLVLAAGMFRSGSTWLYNAARLLMRNSPSFEGEFGCCWVGDLSKTPEKERMLVKVHDYDDALVGQAQVILYSYRDVRDALASYLRKFDKAPSIESVEHMIRQDELWNSVADMTMRYESMIVDRAGMIDRVAEVLGLDDYDSDSVALEIDSLSYDSPGPRNGAYHEENLLHSGHITDGRFGSWIGELPSELVVEVESRYGQWLSDRGYLPQGGQVSRNP